MINLPGVIGICFRGRGRVIACCVLVGRTTVSLLFPEGKSDEEATQSGSGPACLVTWSDEMQGKRSQKGRMLKVPIRISAAAALMLALFLLTWASWPAPARAQSSYTACGQCPNLPSCNILRSGRNYERGRGPNSRGW